MAKIESVTLKKIEKYWTIIIEREDGDWTDYRFNTKNDARRWARLAGLDLNERRRTL